MEAEAGMLQVEDLPEQVSESVLKLNKYIKVLEIELNSRILA